MFYAQKLQAYDNSIAEVKKYFREHIDDTLTREVLQVNAA